MPCRCPRATVLAAGASLAVAACADPLTFTDETQRPRVTVVATAAAWSDPNSWPSGHVPSAGEHVMIPAGTRIMLDVATAPLASLTIEGSLEADTTRDVGITAGTIMVHGTQGLLAIGREEAPYRQQAVITLTGAPSDANPMGMGTKVLGVMAGGRLELHGVSARKRGWTRLDGTAEVGATMLTLAEPVNWTAGDRVVLAPSGFEPAETEVLTVDAVDGRTVRVTPALRFRHFGERQQIEGQWIDTRAEIGLLTRNIRIESDAEAQTTRFGGHVMVMDAGSAARVEGVEFRNLGQEGRLGRYAFHWHFAGNANGQYLRHSSIHTTFTRGVVIHETSNALVEDVVGYESHSHMFVGAEDGTEQGNVLRRNLGVLARRHADATRRIFSDRKQDEHRPSVFWSANPNQTFEGNAAAAAMVGNGFHFTNGLRGTIPSTIVFRGNSAHSNWSPTGGNDRYPPDSRGHGLFVRELSGGSLATPRRFVFEDFVSYKNSISGAWIESDATILRQSRLADNGTGVVIFRSRLEQSLIVGQTANTIGASRRIGTEISGGVHVMRGQGGEKRPDLQDVTIVNQRDGGLVFLEQHFVRGAQSRGVRYVRTAPMAWSTHWSGYWSDLDGQASGTGVPGTLLPERSRLAATDSCTLVSVGGIFRAWRCDPTQSLGMVQVTAQAAGTTFGDPATITSATGVSLRLEGESRKSTRYAWVAGGGRYALTYGVTTPARQMVELREWIGSEPIELALPAAADAQAFRERFDQRGASHPDLAAPLPEAESLEVFRSSSEPVTWKEPVTGRLYLRMQAGQRLYVCAVTTCQ